MALLLANDGIGVGEGDAESVERFDFDFAVLNGEHEHVLFCWIVFGIAAVQFGDGEDFSALSEREDVEDAAVDAGLEARVGC